MPFTHRKPGRTLFLNVYHLWQPNYYFSITFLIFFRSGFSLDLLFNFQFPGDQSDLSLAGSVALPASPLIFPSSPD